MREMGENSIVAKPILRYVGAKWKLANWITSFIPPHEVYLEPYFGSGAVFFNKPPVRLETINDISGDVVNLFKVMRDRADELIRTVELTPFARQEFVESYEKTGDELEDARRFLVQCWQAHGGKTYSSSGWRNRTRTAGGSFASLWAKLGDRIGDVAMRLKHTQIENQPACKLIPRFNYAEVLIYADPPYPLSTRSGKFYPQEMTDEDHIELIDLLNEHSGPVLLSGYECELYDSRLKHWRKERKTTICNSGEKRMEVLWIK